MNTIAFIREQLRWAHEYLEMVTADVSPELAHWRPPGIANPLAAVYAHAVLAEDGVVNGLLRGDDPLYAGAWEGRVGLREPRTDVTLEWARNLKVELPAFRQYAQAVYAATDGFVASLTEADLDRQIDLTQAGFDHKPVHWVFNALVISHLNNMIGEISCLKGIQGTRGYPF